MSVLSLRGSPWDLSRCPVANAWRKAVSSRAARWPWVIQMTRTPSLTPAEAGARSSTLASPSLSAVLGGSSGGQDAFASAGELLACSETFFGWVGVHVSYYLGQGS